MLTFHRWLPTLANLAHAVLNTGLVVVTVVVIK